jgi:hypothetical protein
MEIRSHGVNERAAFVHSVSMHSSDEALAPLSYSSNDLGISKVVANLFRS